jgi:hypothetical protein
MLIIQQAQLQMFKPIYFIRLGYEKHQGIPVASGMYIIHVDAPGLGEKNIKILLCNEAD